MTFIFDLWNGLKKYLETQKGGRKCFPKEREIWRVHLGKNIGHEQNGSGQKFVRPVLVLKKLNVDTFIILPLTSKNIPVGI